MTGGHSINITASTFSGSALGIGPVTGTFGASPTKRVSLVDTVFLNQMTGYSVFNLEDHKFVHTFYLHILCCDLM
jgi:hypothetical protein